MVERILRDVASQLQTKKILRQCGWLIHINRSNMIHQLNNLFRPRRITVTRIAFALLVAVVADALQIPAQAAPPLILVIDVVAAILTIWALGFHILLLPTLAVELFPIVDMLPTWTGCVAAVIALRKRSERKPPIIDVSPAIPQDKQLPESSPPR
jgi:hypothetical protein